MGSEEIFQKKTALVTGASIGIGNAIATALAKAGYDLIITGYSHPDKLKALADELTGKHSCHITTHVGDISDPAFVKDMFSSIDHLDLLVNNAGISYVGLLQDMSDEDWNRTMGVNLNSVFYTCREAIPVFLRNENDPAGRPVRIKDPAGREVSYLRGVLGEREKLVYPGGKTVTYEYDALRRLVSMDSDEGRYGFAYDENGRLCDISGGIYSELIRP